MTIFKTKEYAVLYRTAYLQNIKTGGIVSLLNQKAICEKLNINPSSFRGWVSGNRQKFSGFEEFENYMSDTFRFCPNLEDKKITIKK